MKMIRVEATADAVTPLLTIERECFSHPLEEKQLAALLADGNTCFFAATEGTEITGYVWLQTVLDEGYIGNVAVRPAFRRRGIADALLETLDLFAASRKLAFLTLEVRVGNKPAIALYEKHGYAEVGRRPGYYTEPKEDAILMTKTDFQEKL